MTFPLTFWAHNAIETAAAVAASSSATGYPVTRVYDRERSVPWKAASAVQVDIDIDLGAAQSLMGLALIDHNFPSPTTVTLFQGSSSPAGTTVITPSVTLNPFYTAFTPTSARYWRIRIPALSGSVVPQLGEAILGNFRSLTLNPSLSRSQKVQRGNVTRDTSPARYSWAVRRGQAVLRSVYGWNALDATDLATIAAAFSELSDGAKKFLLVDDENQVRWVNWLTPEYASVPLGNGLWSIPEIVLEDAP